MQIIIHSSSGIKAAEVLSNKIIINSLEEATEGIDSVQRDYNCQKIIMHRENICDDFFDSKTMLAGQILKVLMDFEVQLIIIGDYSDIEDKRFMSFIKECNNTHKNILFFEDISDALDEIF